MTKKTRRLLLDTLERVTKTAGQAAAGAWLVDQSFDLHALKIAGVAALVAVLTCAAGSRVGDKRSVGLIPAAPEGDAAP